MEELFRTETPEDGKIDRHMYDNALTKLADARDEIISLNKEIEDLRRMLDEVEHEDEVIITTKHPISDIEISFKQRR